MAQGHIACPQLASCSRRLSTMLPLPLPLLPLASWPLRSASMSECARWKASEVMLCLPREERACYVVRAAEGSSRPTRTMPVAGMGTEEAAWGRGGGSAGDGRPAVGVCTAACDFGRAPESDLLLAAVEEIRRRATRPGADVEAELTGRVLAADVGRAVQHLVCHSLRHDPRHLRASRAVREHVAARVGRQQRRELAAHAHAEARRLRLHSLRAGLRLAAGCGCFGLVHWQVIERARGLEVRDWLQLRAHTRGAGART